LPKEITINFLDVGQGDGTIITTPEAALILIDLGSKKNADIAGADAVTAVTTMITEAMKFRKSDIPVLDLLLLTHGDGDHYNLVTTLMAKVKEETNKNLVISSVAIGGYKGEYDQAIRDAVLTPHENNNTLQIFGNSYHDPMATDGTVTPKWLLANGTAKLYLLSANYPLRDYGTKNAKSLVVMLEYATVLQKVILTGDAEWPTENAILGYYATNPGFVESFALKLGHHGSKNGSGKRWVEAVNQFASFASADMKWAHPYCETLGNIVEYIGPGAQLYKHKWLCGAGAGNDKEYRNWDDQVGFYTTMAYMTEKPLQDVEDGRWYSPGLVQGVQYQLSLYDDGTVQLIDTLGGDSGVVKPDRDGRAKALRPVVDAVETEGFRPPIAVRRPPPVAIPDSVPYAGCGV
jgi:competence protein ComEC